jgi:hypothetical protein
MSVKKVSSVGGLSATKRLLLSKQYPLILWLPQIRKRFPTISETFAIDSDFSFDDFSELAVGPSITLPILGYSDFSGFSGGLIVRNNWGAVGHTAAYLEGLIPIDLDRKFCPNPRDVSQWTGATLDCLRTNDISACSRDIETVYGVLKRGAVELECFNDGYCNMTRKYVMLRGIVNGTMPELVEIGEDGPVLRKVDFPAEFLWRIFRRTDLTSARYDRCGFVLLPSGLLQMLAGMRAAGSDGWRALDVEVEWEKRSFPRQDPGLDYSEIIESMGTVEEVDVRDIAELIGL